MIVDYKSSLIADKSFYKKHEEKIKIDRLHFEVTNICNAKCVFCAYRFTLGSKRKGFMSFDIFKKALDEYIGMGGEKISFTPTVGDPLLDPGLIDKIEYALETKKLSIVYFYSNGIALSKDNLYKKLIDSRVHSIEISTSGFKEDSYEKIFGVKAYPRFLEGVHQLLKYNVKCGSNTKISLNFRSPDLPGTIFSSPDYKEYIEPYTADVNFDFLTSYDNWGGAITQNDMYGVMSLKAIPKYNRLPCVRTFDASILYDGSVRLCACRLKTSEFDGLVIGNVMEEFLPEIFYSEKAYAVRESFVKNEHVDVCKNCSFYSPISPKWVKERLNRREE